jgi:hypothetical protein
MGRGTFGSFGPCPERPAAQAEADKRASRDRALKE